MCSSPRCSQTLKDETALYFVMECLTGGALYKHVRGSRLPADTVRFYAAEVSLSLHAPHLISRLWGAGDYCLARGTRSRLRVSGLESKQCGSWFMTILAGLLALSVIAECCHQVLDDRGHLRLIDFEYAKKIDGERTMSYCGTPHSMAPEMVAKTGHGKEVDWW